MEWHPSHVPKTMEKHVFFATSMKGYHPDVVKTMEKTRVFCYVYQGCRPNVVKPYKNACFLYFYQRVPSRCGQIHGKTRVFSTLIKGPLVAALRNRPMAPHHRLEI